MVRAIGFLLGGVLVLLGIQAFLFMGILGPFADTLDAAGPALRGMATGLAVAGSGGWLMYGAVRDFPHARSALSKNG